MSARGETIVVGAGVIGLSVARELLRRGRRVRVVDPADRPASATAAAGGMLAPISEAEVETDAQLRFGEDSLERFPAFVAEVERESGEACGYRREGTLWVAVTPDDRAELEHLAATLAARGLEHEPLDGERVRALEPHLSTRVCAGVRVVRDQQVDPRRLTRALERAVTAGGGSVSRGIAVREVTAAGGRVSGVEGETARGERWRAESGEVVVCAGPWCGREPDGVRLPLEPLGLRPIKGQLLRLRGPRLLDHVVRHPHGYLVPRADGELLIGATMEELGFDEQPTAGAALDLLRHAWQVLPGLYDLELAEISVGLRSAVDDQLPVIGATAVDGLYLATGHFRGGILLAPATAWYLAEGIAGGGAMPDEIAPFSPRRLEAARETGRRAGTERGNP